MNYAECAAENGKSDEAYGVLKRIRQRAGIEAGSNGMYGLKANMSHDEMIAAIMWNVKLNLPMKANATGICADDACSHPK